MPSTHRRPGLWAPRTSTPSTCTVWASGRRAQGTMSKLGDSCPSPTWGGHRAQSSRHYSWGNRGQKRNFEQFVRPWVLLTSWIWGLQQVGSQKRQSNFCEASFISRAHHSGLTNIRGVVQLPSIDRGEVHRVTHLIHTQSEI